MGVLHGTTVLQGARPHPQCGSTDPGAWEACLFILVAPCRSPASWSRILTARRKQQFSSHLKSSRPCRVRTRSSPGAWWRAVGCSWGGPATNSPGTLTWCHSCPHSMCPSPACSCWRTLALRPSRPVPERVPPSPSWRVPAILTPGAAGPGPPPRRAQGQFAAAPPAATGDHSRLAHPPPTSRQAPRL